MGIRVDSEWWWVSEDTGAEECLRQWMMVIQDTAESMKSGFLFHQPMWGWDQLEQGLEEGGGVLTQLPETTLQLPSCIQKV